ncbi:MAG: ABC transporter permease, partial [Roseicyclus sp.]
MTAPDAAATAAPVAPARRLGALRALLRSPSGAVGLAIVLILVIAAVFAPLIAPHDPFRMAAGPRLSPPSLDHLMGTDQLGRDVFS